MHIYLFFFLTCLTGSLVGLANRCGFGGQGFERRSGRDVFLFSIPVQTSPKSNPSSFTMGPGLFPDVKRPGRGVDYPLYLAPRLRMSRAITLLHLRVFMAFYRVTFTFTFMSTFTFTYKEFRMYRV